MAKAQVGKPYVWGATGPYSFDCSGLTSYVYSLALGKYITRTTYTQVHQGKTVAVSTATLKKGDLLFWGSKSSPYHVGIYVGGGKFVHAATPSQGVIKQSLSYYFWPSTANVDLIEKYPLYIGRQLASFFFCLLLLKNNCIFL